MYYFKKEVVIQKLKSRLGWEEVEKSTMEALIFEVVVEVSMEDDRGALIDVVVSRVKKEYPAVDVRKTIDELIDEGNLLVNHRDESGVYVVRG